MERSRENSQDFASCSKTASKLRRQVILFTLKREKTLYHRLLKLTRDLLILDKTSVRGARDPKIGMSTPQGIALLKKFKVSDKPVTANNLNLYQLLLAQGYLKIPLPKKKKEKSKARPVNRTKTNPKLRRPARVGQQTAAQKHKVPARSKKATAG